MGTWIVIKSLVPLLIHLFVAVNTASETCHGVEACAKRFGFLSTRDDPFPIERNSREVCKNINDTALCFHKEKEDCLTSSVVTREEGNLRLQIYLCMPETLKDIEESPCYVKDTYVYLKQQLRECLKFPNWRKQKKRQRCRIRSKQLNCTLSTVTRICGWKMALHVKKRKEILDSYDYMGETCMGNVLCGLNRFQCQNNRCIHRKYVCDEKRGCRHGDDERHCGGAATTPLTSTTRKVKTPTTSATKKVKTPPTSTTKKVKTPPTPTTKKVKTPPTPTTKKVKTPPYSTTKKVKTPPTSTTKNVKIPPTSTTKKVKTPPTPTTKKVKTPPTSTTKKVTTPPTSTTKKVKTSPTLETNEETVLSTPTGQDTTLIPEEDTVQRFLSSIKQMITDASNTLEENMAARLRTLKAQIVASIKRKLKSLEHKAVAVDIRTEESIRSIKKRLLIPETILRSEMRPHNRILADNKRLDSNMTFLEDLMYLHYTNLDTRTTSVENVLIDPNTKYYSYIKHDSNCCAFCNAQTGESDDTDWIVIQRRIKGDESFNRPWADYKQGFGYSYGDIWLGNDYIANLTRKDEYELRIEVKVNGVDLFAHYTSFKLHSESDNYRLYLGQHSGTLDSIGLEGGIERNNYQPFSTFDRDNDVLPTGSCAKVRSGGWWYRNCQTSSPNGRWGDRSEKGMFWFTGTQHLYLSCIVMKIRRTY